MIDRHPVEITVMQFTGHSLPMHHSEWHFWPGRRSKYNTTMVSSLNKQTNKQNQSDSEGEAYILRFIVIESLEVCLAKFLPFLTGKVISTRTSPKNVKKIRNGNLLVEVESQE